MKVSHKTFWIVICQYSIAFGFIYTCLYPILNRLFGLPSIDGEFLLWGFAVCSGGKIAKKYFDKEKYIDNE